MTAYSKYFEKIRIRPQPGAEAKADARQPICQWDGCNEPGTHRAPVGRLREGEYFRFCFDHVREYNKGVNYFSGLPDTEIARYQKEALTAGYYSRIGDPYNLFSGSNAHTPRERKAKPLEAKALETLGLATNATGAEIKARYKQLVKQHHPDANGGDRGSEDRFRDVLQAYRVLKQAGLC